VGVGTFKDCLHGVNELKQMLKLEKEKEQNQERESLIKLIFTY
jgi:hypothetical protein